MMEATSAEDSGLVPIATRERPTVLRIGRSRVPGGGRHSYHGDNYWALHLYFVEARLELGEHRFDLEPGSVTVTPANTLAVYDTGEPLDHIFVHFRPPAGPESSVPLHVGVSPTTEPVATALESALQVYRNDPLWAEVKLWDTLLRLSDISERERSPARRHPALEQALTYIELYLPVSCTLSELAEHCGVSATHLNRLFTSETGVSAMRYLRDRRMELAHYLLVATELPVKRIGYQVGIPDVHAFNKLCKRYFGHPPTEVRRRGY
jgi:AraC-like DNA-binding protein